MENGEVLVVVDIGEELIVMLAISCPVDAVNVFVVEFVVHLTHHMVENVFTLSEGAVVGSLELDVFR